MLKEALEQSGIAGLVGWNDTADNQDNVFRRALVSKPFTLRPTTMWLTRTGSRPVSFPAIDHANCNQGISDSNPVSRHLVRSALDIDHCLRPLLLQLHPADRP